MALNICSGATYVIVNTASNTAMDISGDDKKSIVGNKKTGSKSQQWTITFVEGWHIKNAETGQFLAFEGDPKDGAPVIVTGNAFTWHLWPDTLNIFCGRICVASTALQADLDKGSGADGTRVIVWTRTDGTNQVWSFESVRINA